jgi:hypothetical protein
VCLRIVSTNPISKHHIAEIVLIVYDAVAEAKGIVIFQLSNAGIQRLPKGHLNSLPGIKGIQNTMRIS